MKVLIYSPLFLLLFFYANTLSAEDAVNVEVTPLSELALYPQRSSPASVVSLNDSGIAAEIAAKINSIAVRVGDIVEKDQILVELDCTDYALARDQADAQLKALGARIELAKRRLERTRTLTKKQSVSEELLDERESDLAVLLADRAASRAGVKLASARVSDCVIKSPFRALVTKRISAEGSYADIGKPLVQVLDIDQLEISAQVYAQDVGQLKTTNNLFFEHDGNEYPVNLRTILPSINSETRNSEIRLLFQNGPALPGAAGKLVWREVRPHIPGNLIVRRDGELGVFVLENSKAKFRVLASAQAGRASPIDFPIDTLLITEGHFSLNDDDIVVVK